MTLGWIDVLFLFMFSPDDMADLQQRALKELVELGLEVSRELKAKVALVASVEDAERLALAFHRATRSVRLSLALMSRLACDQREVRRVHRASVERAVETRKDQIRASIANDVWNETEGEDAEALLEALEDRLDLDGRFEAFLQGPVEPVIEAIRRDLGLAARALGLSGAAPLDPPAPQSSA